MKLVQRIGLWPLVGTTSFVGKSLDYLYDCCKVCSKHFDAFNFKNFIRNRLNEDAIPGNPSGHLKRKQIERDEETINLAVVETPPAKRVLNIIPLSPARSTTTTAVPTTTDEQTTTSKFTTVKKIKDSVHNPDIETTDEGLMATPMYSTPARLDHSITGVSSVLRVKNASSNNVLETSIGPMVSSSRKARFLTPKSKRINIMRIANTRLKKKLGSRGPESEKSITLNYLRRNLDPTVFEFVSGQVRLTKDKPKGRRFTIANKI